MKHSVTCLEAVWSCNFCIKNFKIISAQKKYLAKSYEYLQMLDRSWSYYTKAVLNRLSDAFYKLVIYACMLLSCQVSVSE